MAFPDRFGGTLDGRAALAIQLHATLFEHVDPGSVAGITGRVRVERVLKDGQVALKYRVRLRGARERIALLRQR